MDRRTDNNSLYFIVGGLVVAALLFGFIIMANNPRTVPDVSPAAGEYVAPSDTMAGESQTEINIRDNEDGGITGTITERDSRAAE